MRLSVADCHVQAAQRPRMGESAVLTKEAAS
jgi:hypothetical protein